MSKKPAERTSNSIVRYGARKPYAGLLLCHNHVVPPSPTAQHGEKGFRVWVGRPDLYQPAETLTHARTAAGLALPSSRVEGIIVLARDSHDDDRRISLDNAGI
jgi:hypothetical protein